MKRDAPMADRTALAWFLGLSVLAHAALLSLHWPAARHLVTDAPLAVELVRAGRPASAPEAPGTARTPPHKPLPQRHRQTTPVQPPARAPSKTHNHSKASVGATTTARQPPAARTSPVRKQKPRNHHVIAETKPRPTPAVRAPARQRRGQPTPATTPRPAAAASAPDTAAAPRRSARPASPALDETAKKALLRRALAQQLAFHRYYPPLARMRGWQGEVRLRVRVGSDGRLSRVRVLQTSGHALLDRAAVRSVHAVHGIHHPPQWLRGTHFDIVLPVVYKLLDG